MLIQTVNTIACGVSIALDKGTKGVHCRLSHSSVPSAFFQSVVLQGTVMLMLIIKILRRQIWRAMFKSLTYGSNVCFIKNSCFVNLLIKGNIYMCIIDTHSNHI